MILGELVGEYSASFARRAMADLAFKDAVNNYCVVDVKTHREGTAFNMPNLTSVDRLARFYEDDANFFVMLMVKYAVVGTKVTAQQVHFVPIEHLKWDCLTLGALGTGQIQIADSKRIEIDPSQNRRAWMLEFCDTVLAFYPREIVKITKRIGKFEKVKEFLVVETRNLISKIMALSEQSRAILQAIAKGHTYEQILVQDLAMDLSMTSSKPQPRRSKPGW